MVYLEIHLKNIPSVCDIPPYYTKYTLKFWTKFVRNFNIVQLTTLEKFQILLPYFELER